MNNTDEHPAWGPFEIWAADNNVSLVALVDWQPWWECFQAGYDTGYEVYR